jgi:Dehydrogenases with different specificities (related to short-chain alcohol dehydrogenases)
MNRTAIITRGATVTGIAIAESLLHDGWSVAILDTDEDALRMTEEALSGEDVLILPADMSDEDEADRVFDTVVDTLGLCSALINCIASRHETPFEETSPEMLRELLELNLVGPFVAIQAACSRMADQLSIVNIMPASALRIREGNAGLAASQKGLQALSEIFVLENTDRPVRINSIATAGSGGRRTIWTGKPVRIPTPEDVASLVRYLLSDDARLVNGETIRLGDDDSG